MKKLLLGLGTVAAVIAPVASVIACSSTKTLSLDFTDLKTPADLTNMFKDVMKKMNDLDKDETKTLKLHFVDGDSVFDAEIGKGINRDEFTPKYLAFLTQVFKNHGGSVPSELQG